MRDYGYCSKECARPCTLKVQPFPRASPPLTHPGRRFGMQAFPRFLMRSTPFLFTMLALLCTRGLPAQEPSPPAPQEDRSLSAYASDCWRLDGPVENLHPLVPTGEQQSRIVQKGFGPLSRRAVYNVEGREGRLKEVTDQQDQTWRMLRLKRQVLPAAVVVGMLGASALLGTVALTMQVLRWTQKGNDIDYMPTLPIQHNLGWSKDVYAVGNLALMLALILPLASVVPAVLGIIQTLRLLSLPSAFLAEGEGFPTQEAQDLVTTHNNALANRLGLPAVPACSAR